MNNLLFSEMESPSAVRARGRVGRGDFADVLKPWPGAVRDEWELGEIGSSTAPPDTASEQQLVRASISRGQQSESALTDMLFFRRHPQRRNRRLQRSEPGFEPLRREWLTIRDRVVAPVLGLDGMRALFDRAVILFQGRQYLKALSAFERLRHYPGLEAQLGGKIGSTCFYNLGAINRRLNRFSTAIIYFESYLAQPAISATDRAEAQHELDKSKWLAGIAP